MSEQGLAVAGETLLKSCNLISSDLKNKLDITNLILEIDLYEDLFAPAMSATITIVESFGLITDFPIIGEEMVEIEYVTPGFDDKLFTIKKNFYVWKLSNRAMGNDKKSVYLLHLISYEAIKDLNVKVSRSYSGFTHEIVQSIWDNYLKNDNNDVVIEKSGNNIKFVSPYWSPFKIMNYLAARSTSLDAYSTPNFLFYESNKRFYFRSVESILKLVDDSKLLRYFYDQNPKRLHDETGKSVRNVQAELSNVIDINFDFNFDYIKRIMMGVYSHKVIEHDLLRKTLKRHIYNYWYDFDKTTHLDKHPMVSELVEFHDENGLIESKTIVPMVHEQLKIDRAAEILSKRVSLLGQLDMYKLDITVPGRSDVEVGQVIYFDMGQYDQTDSTDKNKDNKDKYLSGKYLITGIQHRVTQTRHRMILQLVKESLASKIVFGDKVE